MTDFARLAARNNADWCDAVCRAHGRPGESINGLWFNRRETPPFYPNAVTLAPDAGAALVDALPMIAAACPSGFAVKDSFAVLDLASSGFETLFTADWIMRRPEAAATAGQTPWRRIETPAALAAWERAWAGEDGCGRVFPDAMLDDPAIIFIAGYADGQVVAGAALNRSDAVMGWSNVFLPVADGHRWRTEAAAFAAELAGGMPLVGYERDDDLAQSLAIGFEPIGRLRISACQGLPATGALQSLA